MTGWITAGILSMLILLALSIYYRSRQHSSRKRFDLLASRIKDLRKNKGGSMGEAVLQQAYSLIHDGLAAGDLEAIYQSIDLLKQAYGEGVLRKNEQVFLTSVSIRAVRAKQPQVAALSLDVFRQILRLLPEKEMPLAIEQLAFIAAVAFRDKQVFLAAKAAEIIFTVLERGNLICEPAIIIATVRALRMIGILALRRQDTGLFRELNSRMAAMMSHCPDNGQLQGEILGLASVWLHRITRENDTVMFEVLLELISQLVEGKLISSQQLTVMVKEWQTIASTASLNPYNQLAAKICDFTLQLVLAREELKTWEMAINGAGQIARMAIIQHGTKVAFPIISPFLVIGRKLLFLELKIGSVEVPDEFRQQALNAVIRECLALAEFTARQDLVSAAGDVLGDYYRQWTDIAPQAGQKSAKRFCQLLVLCWQKTTRQASRWLADDELCQPPLLREQDLKKISFLF